MTDREKVLAVRPRAKIKPHRVRRSQPWKYKVIEVLQTSGQELELGGYCLSEEAAWKSAARRMGV